MDELHDISDNCSLNRKISKDCKKPLVGCLNHKLNLQVNKMVKGTPELEQQISSVHETMSAARGSIKNASILRKPTSLQPVTPNVTRWSGKAHMLNMFVRIREQLAKESLDERGSIPMDRGTPFFNKVKKNAVILSEINEVTKILQTRFRQGRIYD